MQTKQFLELFAYYPWCKQSSKALILLFWSLQIKSHESAVAYQRWQYFCNWALHWCKCLIWNLCKPPQRSADSLLSSVLTNVLAFFQTKESRRSRILQEYLFFEIVSVQNFQRTVLYNLIQWGNRSTSVLKIKVPFI